MHCCLASHSFAGLASPSRPRTKSSRSSHPVASGLPTGRRRTDEGQVVVASRQIAQKFLRIGTSAFPPTQQGQTVVGASRRRAAPGTQPVEFFATPPVCGYATATKFGVCWQSAEMVSSVSFVHKYQRPNPSIERTSNGGAQWCAPSRSATPLAAAHVKR